MTRTHLPSAPLLPRSVASCVPAARSTGAAGCSRNLSGLRSPDLAASVFLGVPRGSGLFERDRLDRSAVLDTSEVQQTIVQRFGLLKRIRDPADFQIRPVLH